MRIEKMRNATNIIITGLTSRIVTIILQFVTKTLFIRYLGSECVGLDSLFASILSALNITELGLSTSIVFSMYKPIAEDDSKTICALMNLYRKCYYAIGTFILIAGLVILPFVPKIIKGSVPYGLNIYILYLINLGSSVSTYFLFSYRSCLLSAHQRGDIKNRTGIIISILQYGTQILFLYLFKNYYVYVVIKPLYDIISNLTVAYIATKKYPQYRPIGNVEQGLLHSIISKVKAMLLYKVGGILSNSFDSIVLSAFGGLLQLGLLNNYLFILNTVRSVIGIFCGSLTAGIGNALYVDRKEKIYNLFQTLDFIQYWISVFCACCILCLAQPFISMWIGEDKLLPTEVLICCVVYFAVFTLQDIVNVFRDAFGIWDKDRFRPIISGLFNLFLNLILVKKFGTCGVLLSTIIAEVVFSFGWATIVLFKYCFIMNPLSYYLYKIRNMLLGTGVCVLSFYVCQCVSASGIAEILIKLLICLLFPNITLIVVFRRSTHYTEAKAILVRCINLICKRWRRSYDKIEPHL